LRRTQARERPSFQAIHKAASPLTLIYTFENF
jgi:hypothetical protein